MGFLRRRGKKRLISMIFYDIHGVQREESTRTDDWTAAETMLAIREGKIAEGENITPAIGGFTFDDGAPLILADYELNDRDSIDDVRRSIELHLRPWFTGKRLAPLTTADFTAYARHRKTVEKAANATINRELAVVKRIYRLAVRSGLLLHVPYIAMLPERTRRAGFLEREAFVAIRGHLAPDLQPVATVAYYTGWRVKAELLPLEWRMIDRGAGVMRLDAALAKNDEPRVFTYGNLPELVAAIDACWAVHEELAAKGKVNPYVFVRWTARGTVRRGARVKSWRKAWRAACRRAGRPGQLVHDFRRTAVRNLERIGVPRKSGRLLVGHKTDAIYERYAIVNEADLSDATARLAASAAAGAPPQIPPSSTPPVEPAPAQNADLPLLETGKKDGKSGNLLPFARPTRAAGSR